MANFPQIKTLARRRSACFATGGSLVLLLMLIAEVPAQDFTYTNNNGAITIMGYTGPGGAVTIPSAINGLPVTCIGANAFGGHTNLTSVMIFNSVTNIGDGAFSYCSRLTYVMIGENVTSLGEAAFSYCGSLFGVHIPDSLTNIGTNAFFACSSLSGITVGLSNPSYSGVDGVLFNKLQTTLIQYPPGNGGSYTVPSSVTSIGNYAFAGCGLTNVVISDSVTNIGNGAFEYCQGLSGVKFGNRVITIGDGAFVFCGLTSVTIPNSVTNIGAGAFSSCRTLSSVLIGNNVITIGDVAFAFCSLTSIVIPSGVISIGEDAFSSFSLSAINVDPLNRSYSSVDGVLFNRSQTTLVKYPGGKGGSYTVPNSVTGIGRRAFADCTGLTNVIIAESVTSIGDQAFEQCSSLSSLTIPNSVTKLGEGAFNYCTGLSSVTIPNNVTSIGDLAFYSSGLTNVTIPNSITQIGTYAFSDCFSLTSVTIPNSVISIGDLAFYDCWALKGVYFQGNAPSLGSGVFNDSGSGPVKSAATVYYLPGAMGWGTTFGGLPTALWVLPNPVILSTGPGFSVQSNGFGFIVSWATNASVVFEASTDLINPVWRPLQTNALTGGTFYFSDPQWTNYPSRVYRVRSPLR